MPFSVATSTLGGSAARLITGSGNLDDLASALSAHGVTKVGNTVTFAGTGADTFYVMDGALTEQRNGTWEIRIGTQSFFCLCRLAGSSSTLGRVESNGSIASRVDIRYLSTHFPQGSDPYTSGNPFKCYVGAGSLTFHAGSLYYECASRSDMDIFPGCTLASFNAVQVSFNDNLSFGYAHFYTSQNITTTSKTSFLNPGNKKQEVTLWGNQPVAPWNVTINSFYTTTGLSFILPGANTHVIVEKPQYTELTSFAPVLGSTARIYDSTVNYHSGSADDMLHTMYRTVATTFKDTLAVNVSAPTPNLIVRLPDASTVTVAYSAGAASYAAAQSVNILGVSRNDSGAGWVDFGTYDFYAVGFGYAASTLAMNVKTAHAGNDGIKWAAVSSKSPLVTTAYASVVTSGFALTTGTDTLAITTARTTSQAAEFLFKHAYDNPTNTYWLTRLHTPATQNASGYVDFSATNITVTGVALSGSAFSTTGTITLAGGATCSAPIVKSSGVVSSGDIDNVTGRVTLTGTARWDITSGGVAPVGSASATNTIRVTSAAPGANFDFQAFVFNAATVFENTSGNPVTLILAGGQIAPTKLETSGTITISAPIIQQSVTLNGVVAGSRVQIYDTTNSVELFNGTSGYSWTDPVPAIAPRNIRVRIAYQSGTSAKNFIEAAIGTCGITAPSNAVSYLASQTDDAVYNANGLDGSAVTGITIVDAVDRMQINISGGTVNWKDIYAYNVFWLATEEGIRDDGSIITAKDVANYTLSLFKIKNTSAVPLKITEGYGVDSVTGSVADILDVSGGSIFPVVDHVVSSVITVSGASVVTGTAADIIAAMPTAVANATAVRTELGTELARLDVAVSTRNATTPPTAEAVAGAVLAAAAEAPIAANVEAINGKGITGGGVPGNEWGPA